MNSINIDFGLHLKQLRLNKGLTQEQLAENADISVSFLGGIERGLKSPTIETVKKLSDALEIPISQLMSFEAKEISDKQTQLNHLVNSFVIDIRNLYNNE